MSDESTAAWNEEGAAAPTSPTESMISKIRWGLVAFILISIIVIVFAAQNTQTVKVEAFWWSARAPLVVIILVTVLVTVILDELVGLILRQRKGKRQAEKEELRQLRGDG